MKILAIRGKNLASLASEFCVDFSAEPLASAGLFAITGVTGSGKSTLLDALCLALYEKTPRLTRAGAQGETIPDVGGNQVGPADPRTILRRGASEGFAEVDFVGSDGLAYRARWSVRRARGKADGKLQNSEVTLTRLSDMQLLGDHKKTESLRLIEACIGLSFAQFTRAVLLAQNDFATFLKASDDERAELLQTLTGTETFTRLSMQAFARQKAENDNLRLIAAQLAGELPMGAEARTAKAGERAAVNVMVKSLEGRKARIEALLRWHERAAQLAVGEREAEARLAAAKLARDNASGRIANFARIEAVQPARALAADVARLADEVAGAAKAIDAQQRLLADAAKRVAVEKDALEQARREVQAAESAKQAAQPALDQAKALDAQVAALAPNRQRAENSRDEAQRQLTQAEARHAALQSGLAQAQAGLQAAQRWLDEHALLHPLADGWQRWETLLEQATALLGERRRGELQCKRLAAEESTSRTALASAQATRSALDAECQTAAEKLAVASQAFAALDAEGIAKRKQAAETRRDEIASAREIANEIGAQQQALQRLHAQQNEAAAALAASGKELARCEAERPLAERELDGAEKMWRSAALAASESVEALRAGLDTGNPCPVCGSLTHPYATENPALASVLQRLETEVAGARRRVTEVVQCASAAAARAQAAKIRQTALAIEIVAAGAARERCRGRWAEHALCAELQPFADDELAAKLFAMQQAVAADLSDLVVKEAQCRAALRARDDAQVATSKVQVDLAKAQDALNALGLAYQRTVQALDSARQKLSESDRQLEAAQGALDTAFAAGGSATNWRERWSAQPEAFLAERRAEVAACLARQREVATCGEKIGALNAALQAAHEGVGQCRRQRQTQTAETERIDRELQAIRADRAKLFAGRPVAQIEADISGATTAARSALEKQQASSQLAELEHSRQGEALRLAVRELEARRGALERAQQALADWIARREAVPGEGEVMTGEALLALLALSPDWIADERRALQAIDGAIERAVAVCDEHGKSRAAHLAARPDDEFGEEPVDSLRALLSQTLADLEPANARLAALAVELALDDERRQKSQRLLVDHDRQAAKARTWSQLSELIGSADGKKFRNFAQQLTLDILLGYANRHLETLSRRYRLERIASSLGLLVVDQDMGDEVRSVHSLSGGESFLVSLALALGLASLSSHRVQVESLFIDEGFGSLDADSLALALDALDSLQAQGRKVGVISHVQEMNERIGARIEVRRLAGGQSRVVAG